MGRQFQVYLLPSDAVRLIQTLRQGLSLRILARRSSSATPVEMESPIITTSAEYMGIGCFLTAGPSSIIKTRQVEAQDYWTLDLAMSEVIEFGGCFLRPDKKSFDRGRFFYETGFYNAEGEWQSKSMDFLNWAENVFKTAKKSLKRDQGLEAYVGEDATRWRIEGGTFIAMAIKGQPPIIAK